MLDLKQETFAHMLGPTWTQRKVSLLENREIIAPKALKCISKTFEISEKLITELDSQEVLAWIGKKEGPLDKEPEDSAYYQALIEVKSDYKLLLKLMKAFDKRFNPPKRKWKF